MGLQLMVKTISRCKLNKTKKLEVGNTVNGRAKMENIIKKNWPHLILAVY